MNSLADTLTLVATVCLILLMTVAFLLVVSVWTLPVTVPIGAYFVYRASPKFAEKKAREETTVLYDKAVQAHRLNDFKLEPYITDELPPKLHPDVAKELVAIGKELFDFESAGTEIPPPPEYLNSIEGARYRDQLLAITENRKKPEREIKTAQMIGGLLRDIALQLPNGGSELRVPSSYFFDDHKAIVDMVVYHIINDEGYFEKTSRILNRHFNDEKEVYPTDYRGNDVVDAYLKGTVFPKLFDVQVPFPLTDAVRMEHAHMVAGSGHGKTQSLQYFLAQDLPHIKEGKRTSIVIDSQGDLINTILKTDFPIERIVHIDPEDIGYPISLNLFSVGQHRLSDYGELEQERLTNSILELYDFVLSSLLEAGLTQKQNVIFRYVTRLMLLIPDATIHTFREILEPQGATNFQQYIGQLEGTPLHFFQHEFDDKEFVQTRKQVLRRLYGVLENRTFERMFSKPQSKFDMFKEMNAGKLILINTSKSLLKENGTQIFGRFFIALIAQSAQERATISERLPVHVYVDEAQDYFDDNIETILAQARKYNVGIFLAHQFLGQLTNQLQASLEANTSIKFAGGVSARDARALSLQMGLPAEAIQHQPKGTFATFVRGQTRHAVPVAIPFFSLEKLPKATPEHRQALLKQMRENYAEPYKVAPTDEPEQPEPTFSPDDVDEFSEW